MDAFQAGWRQKDNYCDAGRAGPAVALNVQQETNRAEARVPGTGNHRKAGAALVARAETEPTIAKWMLFGRGGAI